MSLYEPLMDFHAFRHTFTTAMCTRVGADALARLDWEGQGVPLAHLRRAVAYRARPT